MSHEAEIIQEAFSRAEFERAKLLSDEYAAQLQGAILAGTATPAMMSEMGELLEWARLMVQSFRAQATDQLNSSHVSQIYARPGSSAAPHFGISL